jgi:hypothetical protein
MQSSDYEDQLDELRTRLQAFKALMNSAGWRELCKVADGAITSRRQSVFSQMGAIDGMDAIFSIARSGAEVAGIQFVLALPHILLKDIETDIARVVELRREE